MMDEYLLLAGRSRSVDKLGGSKMFGAFTYETVNARIQESYCGKTGKTRNVWPKVNDKYYSTLSAWQLWQFASVSSNDSPQTQHLGSDVEINATSTVNGPISTLSATRYTGIAVLP